jgi:hypothetical protein
MKMYAEIPAAMLAPCGMTCAVCYVHLKEKKPCMGCRSQDASKPEHCRKCKIKDCAASRRVDFCCECSSFPCTTIKRLDKSYRKRYRVSLIDNALRIKAFGGKQHLLEVKLKWTCPDCGGVISLHDSACSECSQ